jgi:hypothetical protein
MAPASTELGTPAPGTTLTPSQHLQFIEGMESAYEGWLNCYMNQPGKSWGVYSPKGNAFAVRFYGVEKSANNFVRRILVHLSFFPDTKAPRGRRFMSDEEAVLNDWVMVGSDLYGAIQQYKIESPCARTDWEAADKSTAAAR